MKILRLSLLTLGCLLSSGAIAAEPAGNSDDCYYQRVECRAVVLVGGYQAGGFICKTHQEWVVHDRATRKIVV